MRWSRGLSDHGDEVAGSLARPGQRSRPLHHCRRAQRQSDHAEPNGRAHRAAQLGRSAGQQVELRAAGPARSRSRSMRSDWGRPASTPPWRADSSRGACPKTVEGLTFLVPAPEERVIVATLQRMYRHFYLRVCDIVNTAALLESGQLDFAELKKAADLGGIWPGVATYLKIVCDYIRQYRGCGARAARSEVLAAARFDGERNLCARQVPARAHHAQRRRPLHPAGHAGRDARRRAGNTCGCRCFPTSRRRRRWPFELPEATKEFGEASQLSPMHLGAVSEG